ncbi:mitochondrial import receptor subunit TOM20 homolog B-like [Drosophila sulfurigaster albostrigata]|uniref:mitochondrial import receptor subunit TOM20 homolog B-like n=1 Tax=Drosophila sulfurigaster albostrigata TaxID=89887 RepID=UPI002D21DB30|nr:mitochondrial import receptor subunit TOM20 homolog B-like [Drosophila sulfurigaster albostrigata]
MSKLNGATVILIGLATLAIVGYCIYFDSKRRKHPLYKRRLYERRQFERLLKVPQTEHSCSPLNAEVVEYFLQRVYLGETYFRRNDWNRAVHNFSNAIMICADPHIFLCKLRRIIPKELYEQIMARVRLLVHTSDNWSRSSCQLSNDSNESNRTQSEIKNGDY